MVSLSQEKENCFFLIVNTCVNIVCDVSFFLVDLVDMIEKPEGVHNINTKLFFISFPQLHSLQKPALESTNFDYSSAEYRVIAIILDIANYRLFRPVRSDVPAEKPKRFMKIKFLNKAVDAINLPALLRSTSLKQDKTESLQDSWYPQDTMKTCCKPVSAIFNMLIVVLPTIMYSNKIPLHTTGNHHQVKL